MSADQTIVVTALLRHRIRQVWVDICVEKNIDFTKYRLVINNFGTRFEVQLPEIIFSEEEE